MQSLIENFPFSKNRITRILIDQGKWNYIGKRYGIWLVLIIVFMAGCAMTTELTPTATVALTKKGIYHKVRKGETLWRIANTYQVSIDDIIKSNNIPNVAQIEEYQLIFIPGADQARQIIPDKADLNAKEFYWPLKGKIAFYFGDRRGTRFYKGIGIQAQEGEIVCAARNGHVVFADYLSGYGYTVVLDHLDGYYSVYANNATLLVKLDDNVYRGDPVAKVGKKGDLALLHFEIRKNDVAQNPLYYLPK